MHFVQLYTPPLPPLGSRVDDQPLRGVPGGPVQGDNTRRCPSRACRGHVAMAPEAGPPILRTAPLSVRSETHWTRWTYWTPYTSRSRPQAGRE